MFFNFLLVIEFFSIFSTSETKSVIYWKKKPERVIVPYKKPMNSREFETNKNE